MKKLVILIISDYITNLYGIVKDKDNLLSHDVWSGTDYSKNVNSFSKRDNLTSSTEWAFNGKRCLKLTRQTEEFSGYTTEHIINLPTGNYKFTVKVYSPDNNGGGITLFCSEGNEIVNYAKSNNVQTISIEVTNKTITGFRISIYSSLKSVYLDEFKIISQ